MTTTIKLHAALPSGGVPDPLAQHMWDRLGSYHTAIVTTRVAERTEPAHDDDTDPSAKLRITSIEFATDAEDAEHLRQLARERYLVRTGEGTLDWTSGVANDRDGEVDEDTGEQVTFHTLLARRINDRGVLGGHQAHAEVVDVEVPVGDEGYVDVQQQLVITIGGPKPTEKDGLDGTDQTDDAADELEHDGELQLT